MPFLKGQPRPDNAGRRKGSKNKLGTVAAERLAELKCDPLEGMARIAADPDNPPELRGKMFAELAQYVWPKRRAMEHMGKDGGPMAHSISIEFVPANEGTVPQGS